MNEGKKDLFDTLAESLIVDLQADNIHLTQDAARDALRRTAELLLVVHQEIIPRTVEQRPLETEGAPLSQSQ